MDRQQISTEVRADLDWWVESGLIAEYDRPELAAFLDWYEDEWLGGRSWRDLDASDSRVAGIVERFLERRGVLFVYDPECIGDYQRSYRELIDRYVEIADGHLDDIDVDVRGDHAAETDARITVAVGDQTVEGTMEYYTDWADSDNLYRLMRETIAATDADRTFAFMPYDATPDAPTVAFARPKDVHRIALYLRDRTKLDPAPISRGDVLSRVEDVVADLDRRGVFETPTGDHDQVGLSAFAGDDADPTSGGRRSDDSDGPVERVEAFVDRYERKWYDLGVQAEGAGLDWTVQNVLREFLVDADVAAHPGETTVEEIEAYRSVTAPWVGEVEYEASDDGDRIVLSTDGKSTRFHADADPIESATASAWHSFRRLLDWTTHPGRTLERFRGLAGSRPIVVYLLPSQLERLEPVLTSFELERSVHGFRTPPE